jgi:hypothetical protein
VTGEALPGDWPRTIYVCPACGETLPGEGATCRADTHGERAGIAVEVVPLHEADFLPRKDPREQDGWALMSDAERARAMAKYLAKQAAHE